MEQFIGSFKAAIVTNNQVVVATISQSKVVFSHGVLVKQEVSSFSGC